MFIYMIKYKNKTINKSTQILYLFLLYTSSTLTANRLNS